MDTLSTSQSPDVDASVMALHSDSKSGALQFGGSFKIPDGCSGMLVANNKPCDMLKSGEYTLDATSLPMFAKMFNLQWGQAPTKPVDMAIYLFSQSGTTLNWSGRPVVSNNTAYGMTYCDLSGQALVSVMDPPKFYNLLKPRLIGLRNRYPKAQRANIAAMPIHQQADLLIRTLIVDATTATISKQNIVPDQMTVTFPTVIPAIHAAADTILQRLYASCVRVEIGDIPQVKRAPCTVCGSMTEPTRYGSFKRTISLLYVRFGAKREGNFCTKCAAKVSAQYNCAMLVAGWWGYIGIVLTPIYLVTNCYHFCQIAFGVKTPASNVNVSEPLPQEGTWPPPPSAWGSEIEEKQ